MPTDILQIHGTNLHVILLYITLTQWFRHCHIMAHAKIAFSLRSHQSTIQLPQYNISEFESSVNILICD